MACPASVTVRFTSVPARKGNVSSRAVASPVRMSAYRDRTTTRVTGPGAPSAAAAAAPGAAPHGPVIVGRCRRLLPRELNLSPMVRRTRVLVCVVPVCIFVGLTCWCVLLWASTG